MMWSAPVSHAGCFRSNIYDGRSAKGMDGGLRSSAFALPVPSSVNHGIRVLAAAALASFVSCPSRCLFRGWRPTADGWSVISAAVAAVAVGCCPSRVFGLSWYLVQLLGVKVWTTVFSVVQPLPVSSRAEGEEAQL